MRAHRFPSSALWLDDLVADYWSRLDDEIKDALAQERAEDESAREAEAESERQRERLEARQLRRRSRVLGARAITEDPPSPL
jgi:hypothetical protein